MNNKQLLILIITLIVCSSIIGGSIYYGLAQQKEDTVIDETDNITIENITDNSETEVNKDTNSVSSNSNSKTSSSSSYDDGYEFAPQYMQEVKEVSDGIIDRNGRYLEREINGHYYDSEGRMID